MSERPVVVLVSCTAGAADETSLQALTLARSLAPSKAVHAIVANEPLLPPPSALTARRPSTLRAIRLSV